MKNSVLKLALAVLVTASACSKEKIRGEGAVVTESRNTAAFTRVVTNGSTRVHITQGATISVQVKGYANLLPYLETTVGNGTLQVGFKSGTKVSNDNTEMTVTLPALQGVTTNGSADVDATGPFTATGFDATTSGSGSILLQDMDLQTLRTKISGSGSIRAFDATAQRVEVRTEGSGDTEVRVMQSLKATLTGSGSLYYKGTPTDVETSITGSGKVVYRP